MFGKGKLTKIDPAPREPGTVWIKTRDGAITSARTHYLGTRDDQYGNPEHVFQVLTYLRASQIEEVSCEEMPAATVLQL